MKFEYTHPYACVRDITPEIAKAMLETSAGNRKIRGWYVSVLAAAMRRGEWRVTSQGIGFDVNGHLRDAHHRLHACIQAGVPFRSVVVFGLRPDFYEVIDTGMLRIYADRLEENRSATDVLRLGCSLALNTSRPTIDQMRPLIEAGFRDTVGALVEFCGTKRKFYSTAPMKLAACITLMDGGNADFVMNQYRSLCNLDFASMSRSAQALVRQVDSGKIVANETRVALASGFRVFDRGRAGITRIVPNEEDINSSVELVRHVLLKSVEYEKLK